MVSGFSGEEAVTLLQLLFLMLHFLPDQFRIDLRLIP